MPDDPVLTEQLSTGHAFLNPARLLLLFVLAAIVLTLWQVVPLIRIPYEIDYGEGLMLDGALRIWHSQPLYPDPYAFPIVLHDWGPLAYAITAAALPGGAVSFPAGRWMVFVCTVLLAILVGVILRKWFSSTPVALSFGLLLLTLPALRFWLYLLRVDVVGTVFLVIGILLYVRKESRWYWSALFFVLAIFCKYTLIAAPGTVFLDLLLKRRMRQSLAFALLMASGAALGFSIVERTTGGWFAFHMFSTHSDRYSPAQFFALAGLVWVSAPVVTALALWYVVQSLRSGKPHFAALYFIVSAVTSLSAGKLGSATNHFLEWMIASCLCAALAYAAVLTKYPARAMPVTVLLGISVFVAVIAQSRPSSKPLSGLTDCRDAYEYVSNSPSSRVLSETLGPTLMAGKPVQISDPFIYGQLVRHGLWPDRRMEDMLNARYFGLIVLSADPSGMKQHGSDVWPDGLIQAMDRNYRVSRRFACRNAAVMIEPVPTQGGPTPGNSTRGPGTVR